MYKKTLRPWASTKATVGEKLIEIASLNRRKSRGPERRNDKTKRSPSFIRRVRRQIKKHA